jgi:lipid-A-disaccharide synthase
MVIAYQVPALTYRLMRRKAVVQRIGLPNLLISPDLVDERLQDDCNPAELTETLLRLVADESRRALQQRAFAELHQQLAQDSALRVAQALGEMLA